MKFVLGVLSIACFAAGVATSEPRAFFAAGGMGVFALMPTSTSTKLEK